MSSSTFVVTNETILQTRLDARFLELKANALEDFIVFNHMASCAYAIRPDMIAVPFDILHMIIPLAALVSIPQYARRTKQWPLKACVSEGLVIAVFLAGEGFMENTAGFGIKTDYASIDTTDLLWFELTSRTFHRYEAYYINRSVDNPGLERIDDKYLILGETPIRQLFKLHS